MVAIILLFFTSATLAQNYDLGIVVGLPSYSGDLSPQELGIYLDDIRVGGGVFLRNQYSKRLGIRYGLTYGRISASAALRGDNGYTPNFRSDIYEASAIAEITPFYIGYYDAVTVIAPYINLGLAFYQFNPQTLNENDWINLQALGTEGQGLPGYAAPYRRFQASMPIGFGVKFIIQDKLTIGAEVTARKTFTDYLDDRSSATVIYGDVVQGNGELAARISNEDLQPVPENFDASYTRGGSFDDWYYFSGLTLSYRFQSRYLVYKPGKKGVICPRF